MLNITQISVKNLKVKLDANKNIRLVDVREPDEYEICNIKGSTLIPLSQFTQKAKEELKPDQEIFIHCHHGGRSQKACEYLVANGYKNVANVSGGIEAWSLEVDPNVPRY